MKKSKLVLLFIMFIGCGQALGANYPLEIVQPQPSLTTSNRYYKAYPGIEYNVKVGVFGGTYPFTYSLTTYPSGMSVESSTGVITWSNPTTLGSPHNVTVSVTDAESTTVTRSWTLTVTTSGFYFIDGALGNDSNSGTLASPWKTIGGMYKNSKADNTYAGGFIYFRNGTYYTAGSNMVLEDSSRLPLANNAKPLVWMAYPGESVVIDVQYAYICAYSGTANTYFDGIRFINMRPVNGCETNHALSIESNDNNVVVRRCYFYNQATGGPGCNDSTIMITNGGTQGSYFLFSENTSDTGTAAYWLLGYYTNKVVVECNTFRNWNSGSHLIGPKMNNRNWSIRSNVAVDGITDIDGVVWIDTYVTTSNIDVSFNNIKSTGNCFNVGLETNNYGPVYSYRNTYQGPIVVYNYDGSTEVSFTNDIIINANTPKITYSGGGTPVQTDMLTGVSGDNIVDTSGLLLGTYRTTYLGIRGWELNDSDTTAPTLSGVSMSGCSLH